MAPGCWTGAEGEGCCATRAAAPTPNHVKRTIFTRCKMTSSRDWTSVETLSHLFYRRGGLETATPSRNSSRRGPRDEGSREGIP